MRVLSQEKRAKDNNLSDFMLKNSITATREEKTISLAKLKDYLNEWNTSSTFREIFVFGSVALNVDLKDSDIDAVVVMAGVKKEEFFTGFTKFLSGKSEVLQCLAIQAFVPIISFSLYGVEFDLLFHEVESEFDGNISSIGLEGLNASQRAVVSGMLNTNELIKINSTNRDNFQLAVRALKYGCQSEFVHLRYTYFLY